MCYNLIGYNAQKKSVDILNFFLLLCLKILGTRIIFKFESEIPKNCPLIFVSNHQSTYVTNNLEFKSSSKFVSKKKLEKGSSVHNLKRGSVLIDRNGEKGVLVKSKYLEKI